MTEETILDVLGRRGFTRRAFLQLCATVASTLALSPVDAAEMARRLEYKPRPTVIYLSFQECTGCLESLTRSFSPGLAALIFNDISLAYNDTLQAAAGRAAERARDTAMKDAWGKYILIVDGSVPMSENGAYCTVGGRSAVSDLRHAASGAAAVVAVGTCAAFGGLPYAAPNPTGAVPVSDIVGEERVINVPGCPPIAEVITGVIMYYTTFGAPALDSLRRPESFYANTIHDRCYRRPFYDRGMFAKTFDDEGARQGWCLFELGCKGPITRNACATMKWINGTSYPIESGHPCLGCSEPNFWDKGGFYQSLSTPTGHWSREHVLGGAAALGVVAGVGKAAVSRSRQKRVPKSGSGDQKSGDKGKDDAKL